MGNSAACEEKKLMRAQNAILALLPSCERLQARNCPAWAPQGEGGPKPELHPHESQGTGKRSAERRVLAFSGPYPALPTLSAPMGLRSGHCDTNPCLPPVMRAFYSLPPCHAQSPGLGKGGSQREATAPLREPDFSDLLRRSGLRKEIGDNPHKPQRVDEIVQGNVESIGQHGLCSWETLMGEHKPDCWQHHKAGLLTAGPMTSLLPLG